MLFFSFEKCDTIPLTNKCINIWFAHNIATKSCRNIVLSQYSARTVFSKSCNKSKMLHHPSHDWLKKDATFTSYSALPHPQHHTFKVHCGIHRHQVGFPSSRHSATFRGSFAQVKSCSLRTVNVHRNNCLKV